MAANLRALAARCTFAVVDKGRSLSDELPQQIAKIDIKDKGLLQELCYGVLRHLPELEHDVRDFIKKPFSGKQRVGHFLLLVGIYQIKYTRIPDHAAFNETVSACKPLKCDHLKGVINGVLRNFQRQQTQLADKSLAAEPSKLPEAIAFNHPSWFIKKLQSGYPDSWQDILKANMQRPPMWLRVNVLHHSIDEYLALLVAENIDYAYVDERSSAIRLTDAIDVNKLPGFQLGWVSIQDGAAQQAALLLDCQPDDNVLDCCAAPGGKTCHILEYSPKIKALTAIDIEESRLLRVHENLQRLNLKAKVITADAATPEKWWNGVLFDRILLDAPCSGTGVIRRHPDIKWLRKSQDIAVLTDLQQDILKNVWSLLKPGGTLLYATCSVLPEENSQQVQRFVAENSDVEHIAITNNAHDIGWQILSNDNSMDGFYYAKLIKKSQ
ncbi:16S rRNA (cytosine(967)-C(5))-methyltransferase RsmB [Colwellia sp. MB3u-70]|uniref:16S rRNA (cytosine(967)-C(5))-methyltransferase RsmB n=1 Tax=unclassified Colwellia TaxID=196834 RepID=UPI0015F4D775|nr:MULTISPECIES: 16S rRNA (cytosine(967)-C(5))-methyltransferase RsmB [unclassified Colwellia]MBA6294356.1 16S rRNA (cytosine(967)-C(5))-methyltransferase RsmB [Colwellia sp. MB3u-8]MBA6306024.1 16S rRNA (cytosine(967)-C(5))-methyltransferase RsmB [Colwellia sp. MB3u-70]